MVDNKKVGNILWYFGHCISIFSALPALINKNSEYTIPLSFSIAAFGQLITMVSRYIERYKKKSKTNNNDEGK